MYYFEVYIVGKIKKIAPAARYVIFQVYNIGKTLKKIAPAARYVLFSGIYYR